MMLVILVGFVDESKVVNVSEYSRPMEPTFRLAWLGEEEEAEEGDEEVDMEASKEVCTHTGLNKKTIKQ